MPGPALQPTVFLFCRLGDMVMLTPLLDLLHQRYRRPCRVIGTGPWAPAASTGHPDLSPGWSFPPHRPLVFSRTLPAPPRAPQAPPPGPLHYLGPPSPPVAH